VAKMSKNTNINSSEKKEKQEIQDELIITDSSLVLIVLHDKKKLILENLLEKDMTIQDLRQTIGLNPGTIKRHLDDLKKHNLVFESRIEKNDYNITMKYYRAVARSFKISIQIP
jgi:DNA-binding transcriptional ArsR family regulator